MSKILITGGHLTPALAFIDHVRSTQTALDFVFVGRRFAQVDNQQESWEKQEIENRKIKFVTFEATKTRSFQPKTFYQSFLQAKKILIEEKVSLLLSFGGYLALPFALAARSLHLPIITHEQTRVLGRANRLIAPLAQVLAVSFANTSFFYRGKTVVTGNPLRPEIFHSQVKKPLWLKNPQNLPLLYVSGGSQGSKIINQNFIPLVKQLSQKFFIIHQIGRASSHRQPLQEIKNYLIKKDCLLTDLPNYYPRDFLSATELAYLYPRCELAIARAGANTVAELSAFAIPTLYIPLPFANYQEQRKNAQFLVERGAALLLEQTDLNEDKLSSAIEQLQKQKTSLRKNLSARQQTHRQAAAKLLTVVKKVLAK